MSPSGQPRTILLPAVIWADCVMIARLAVELRCYLPGQLDETWAHLRHMGAATLG